MIKKAYSKTGQVCRVTFTLPREFEAQRANLCGEFNQWDTECQPMQRRRDGGFSLTVSLPAGQEYRFRYVLDNERWENDPQADSYAPNDFGSDDSVVKV